MVTLVMMVVMVVTPRFAYFIMVMVMVVIVKHCQRHNGPEG